MTTVRKLFLLTSYALLGSCGALVFVAVPSNSLVSQGGRLIAYIWGVFCLVGGASAIAGVILNKRAWEVLGAALGATASLTWCTALVLQAVSTQSGLPLTAACMVASLTGMFAHRCGGEPSKTVVIAEGRRRREGRPRWWWRRRTP